MSHYLCHMKTFNAHDVIQHHWSIQTVCSFFYLTLIKYSCSRVRSMKQAQKSVTNCQTPDLNEPNK